MGTKHTPGPWEVGPVDDTVVTHVGADGVRLVVAEIDGDYNQPETWPIMEANARLIAAAPELLDFARQIFVAKDNGLLTLDTPADETLANVLSRGRAAILKATGGQS